MAAANALTTVAAVRQYMSQIPSSTTDTLIDNTIDRISAMAEKYCNRLLKSQTVIEYITPPSGSGAIFVRGVPIIALQRVAMGFSAAMNVSYTGVSPQATVEVSTLGVTVRSWATNTVVENTLLFGTYTSMSTLATAISAVSGWSATAVIDGPSQWLFPQTMMSATPSGIGGSTTLYYPGASLGVQQVNPDTGRIVVRAYQWYPAPRSVDLFTAFGAPRWQQLQVIYTGGYATIPADLEQAAIWCVTQAMQVYGAGSPTPENYADLITRYFQPWRFPPRNLV